MSSERECINGNWYYYLKATGKWHVYVWSKEYRKLIKIVEDLISLADAQKHAREYDNFLRRYKNDV